jgi:ABC-type nitrate/sulfonate/bicarbonate transport system substrate-binding protein
MLPRKLLVFLTLVSICVLAQACISCNNRPNQPDELTLADASVVWWMGPGIIAQKQNIYEKHRLTVKSFDVQTGLASKNAVLSGSADIGLVASAPLATGAFSNENLIVLCSYVESNALLSVITPKSGDGSAFSQPVPPVAIVKGTISEFYFYNYMTKTLHASEAEIKSVNQVNVKPPDVVNAMKSGSAKSAAIWEPFGTMIAAADSNLKVNRPADVYTHRIYIVTTPEVLQKKRSAVEKFVQSFEEACALMKTDPKTAKEIIKSAFPPQEPSMNELWDKVDFSLKVDYDKMKALIVEDGEILFHLGLTPKDNAGNPRQLRPEDVQYLFNHDFKLLK